MPKKIPLPELEFNKIAIIRFGGEEEIMQTLPTIRILKRQYKDAQIYFVIKEEFAVLLRNVKEITKIYSIKKERWALTKIHDELAKEFCDLALDLQNDFQSSFLYSAFPGVPKRMYNKCIIEKFIQKIFGIQQNTKPLWKRFLDTLPRQNYEVLQTDFEISDYCC